VKKSSYYNILPSEGIFIPTDSLAIVLTTAFIDRAITPSGPNRLDINLDFKRDFVGDTIIPEKVDSITFSLIAVTPEPYDTLLGTRPQIELLFNSSVYAASVDSSLVNNRSLLITSKYNNGKQLSFDSIGINENRVTFRIARSLFYSDSLSCRFRGATIRDIMGFPSDNNDDGIADPMFDSSSSSDDVIWWYKVKPISIVSVAPAANIAVSSVSPPISILFSEPLRAGSYDLDTSVNNRSITVRSVYRSQNVSFRRIELSADSLTLTFYPSVTFFSNDTIRCEMHGFTKGFNYEKPLNLPDNSTEKFAGYQWRFFTGSIGFYTYPNPYKPGKDPRHCNSNGPCGIWFKNLHVLKTGNRSVIIKIYSINAYQIFDSDKSGI
jgi:hypothetical protein